MITSVFLSLCLNSSYMVAERKLVSWKKEQGGIWKLVNLGARNQRNPKTGIQEVEESEDGSMVASLFLSYV